MRPNYHQSSQLPYSPRFLQPSQPIPPSRRHQPTHSLPINPHKSTFTSSYPISQQYIQDDAYNTNHNREGDRMKKSRVGDRRPNSNGKVSWRKHQSIQKLLEKQNNNQRSQLSKENSNQRSQIIRPQTSCLSNPPKANKGTQQIFEQMQDKYRQLQGKYKILMGEATTQAQMYQRDRQELEQLKKKKYQSQGILQKLKAELMMLHDASKNSKGRHNEALDSDISTIHSTVTPSQTLWKHQQQNEQNKIQSQSSIGKQKSQLFIPKVQSQLVIPKVQSQLVIPRNQSQASTPKDQAKSYIAKPSQSSTSWHKVSRANQSTHKMSRVAQSTSNMQQSVCRSKKKPQRQYYSAGKRPQNDKSNISALNKTGQSKVQGQSWLKGDSRIKPRQQTKGSDCKWQQGYKAYTPGTALHKKNINSSGYSKYRFQPTFRVQ